MGSEDRFHKNRERKATDLKRKSAKRDKQPRVLIVCEDSKSSAYYLQDLAKDLGLSAIDVRGKECDSAPSSVLEYALAEYAKSKESGDAYDRVFCVFDRDQHHCFDATVQAINAKIPANKFLAITTTPCFEFWLILHFSYETSPYSANASKSSCDNANSRLRSMYWADYEKSKRSIYSHIKDKTATAIINAKKLESENLVTGSNNPQTNMHELVEYLQSISNNKQYA